MTAPVRPVTILVAALGGQGGGVLAEWLVAAATLAGFAAQSTSIPGVAQRTGATTYYIEIDPRPSPAALLRPPVFSLLPVPGGIDLLVASELLEAARVAASGFPSPARTVSVVSTSRTLTTSEKMSLGDGRFESARLLQVLRDQSQRLATFDMESVAESAGTAVSAVMLGAIAASSRLPFGREACESAIRESGVGVEGSLRGFAAGLRAMGESGATERAGTSPPEDVPENSRRSAERFPLPAQRMIALGHARLVEYQDARYAARYLGRLARIRSAEDGADGHASHQHALLRETARFLALWMAFDDVVRVAQLKSAPQRLVRVRAEVRAGTDDVVRVIDYFKPGVAEIAGLLPPFLARRLIAWDAGRQRSGKRPFALAIRLRSDGLPGQVALRALAGLRRIRPRSARFQDEQLAIDRWLDAIVAGAAEDWTVGWEIACCGRLVKGYGATNERAKRNLMHIIAHVAASSAFSTGPERAKAIASAREAALADEDGVALDRMLMASGAPPRPPVVSPIVWHRKPAVRKEVA